MKVSTVVGFVIPVSAIVGHYSGIGRITPNRLLQIGGIGGNWLVEMGFWGKPAITID
jgi:hypothetical protein